MDTGKVFVTSARVRTVGTLGIWNRLVRSRWGQAATLALATSLVMTISEVPARRAEAAPKPKPVGVLERPDEMAALITARMTGQSVRITGMTTESAEYIAHPNGQIEATVHAGPVRMRQDHKWVPIDLTLQPAADGSVQAKAHPLDLRISGKRAARVNLPRSVPAAGASPSAGRVPCPHRFSPRTVPPIPR